MKNIAVFGLYQTKTHIEEAIDALKACRFSKHRCLGIDPGERWVLRIWPTKNTRRLQKALPLGALRAPFWAAHSGGWRVLGLLAIPGIGPFLAAGPIVAALAGMGAVGAIGGVTGALVGAGIPEYEAKRFEGRIKHGGILLSVHCDGEEWVKKAKAVLVRTGC